jgi:GPI-anchor transamidase subunit T
MRCDQTKPYASEEVCFPMEGISNSPFSLEEIFGRPIQGVCPISQANDAAQVHIRQFPAMEIDPKPTSISNGQAHYTLTGTFICKSPKIDQPFNFHVSFAEDQVLSSPPSPPLTVSRGLTGHGQERGGLQVLMKNTSPTPLQIVYLESLPWFMKPYLHTLKGTINHDPIPLSTLRYRPAIDRLRGTQLEIGLSIPANTTLSLTWEFDKSILRYTEYPPDANRGFDVAYSPTLLD